MNILYKNVIILFLVMCGIFIISGWADAAGNIRMGQMEIHPYVGLQEEFSDNIYKTATDLKRDSITILTPGISILWPSGRHRLEAEYYVIDRRYDTYPGEDTTDKYAKGLLGLQFGSYFNLTVSDAYAKSHEPRDISSTGFIEVFRTNAASASATYQLAGRSKVQVDYTVTSWNFVTSNFRDRDEKLVAGYIYYRFLPKTSTFIEYDRKMVDFTLATTTLDNYMDTLSLGFTWDIDGSSKGTIKAGRTAKDFEDPAEKDFTVWTWSVKVNHNFSDLTTATIIGSRDVNETNFSGTSYFITTGAYADLTHKFASKMAFVVRGSYGTGVYSNAVAPSTTVREDKTNMLGAGLKYFMKDWLEFGADYNKRNRDSNINVNDYRETLYILSTNLTF
jgi:hypothetical protein